MASLVPSFSGGKDSTYLVLRLHELGIKVADIVCFDTGWEFPQMEEHIAQVEDVIKRKITVLKPRESFDFLFGQRIKSRSKTSRLPGYGWATMRTRWCTAEKRRAMAAYATALTWRGLQLPIVQSIGYAADELGRVAKHVNKPRPQFQNFSFPLVEWGITEADALAYCTQRGFTWNGLYEIFDRVSCSLCPLGGISRAEKIYKHFPHIWQRMLEMDSWLPEDHPGKKYTGKYTVADLDKRFSDETKRLQQGRLPGMDTERHLFEQQKCCPKWCPCSSANIPIEHGSESCFATQKYYRGLQCLL